MSLSKANSNGGGQDAEDDCPICLLPLGDDVTHTLDCGHRFHTGCIVESLRRSGPTCPMCRAAPQAVQPEGDAEDDAALLSEMMQTVCCGQLSQRTLNAAVMVLSALLRGNGGVVPVLLQNLLSSGGEHGDGGGAPHTWSFHVRF